MENRLPECLYLALQAAFDAGKSILEIYNCASDYEINYKDDNSPLTVADKKSHNIITGYLNDYFLDQERQPLPILSEEGNGVSFSERKKWEYYWLIDPLDGTKEFIKKNGEFTVNLAIIHNKSPVLGVVYVPVKSTFYFALPGIGAYKLTISKTLNFEEDIIGEIIKNKDLNTIIDNSIKLPIKKKPVKYSPESTLKVIVSRSHINDDTKKFINKLKEKYKKVDLVYSGSSLKLCLVAEGKADIYPRLGPTMEWDTAAAHAVISGAGKRVTQFGVSEELIYNSKEDLLNPWFIAE